MRCPSCLPYPSGVLDLGSWTLGSFGSLGEQNAIKALISAIHDGIPKKRRKSMSLLTQKSQGADAEAQEFQQEMTAKSAPLANQVRKLQQEKRNERKIFDDALSLFEVSKHSLEALQSFDMMLLADLQTSGDMQVSPLCPPIT